MGYSHHPSDRRGPPMNLPQLQEYRLAIAKMRDSELANQYRWLHDLVTLKDGEPTSNVRVVQKFIQVWREANRRGRITPFPKAR
jgi:hypothetical protein